MLRNCAWHPPLSGFFPAFCILNSIRKSVSSHRATPSFQKSASDMSASVLMLGGGVQVPPHIVPQADKEPVGSRRPGIRGHNLHAGCCRCDCLLHYVLPTQSLLYLFPCPWRRLLEGKRCCVRCSWHKRCGCEMVAVHLRSWKCFVACGS